MTIKTLFDAPSCIYSSSWRERQKKKKRESNIDYYYFQVDGSFLRGDKGPVKRKTNESERSWIVIYEQESKSSR